MNKLFAVLIALTVFHVINSKPVKHGQTEPWKKSFCGVQSPAGPAGRSMGEEGTTTTLRYSTPSVENGIWKQEEITWALVEETEESKEVNAIDVIAKAFTYWEAVIPRKFKMATDPATADIKMRFVSGDHEDNHPFDGRLGVYAHAFAPRDGRIHFDNDEWWYSNDGSLLLPRGSPINLLHVAIHEIGHNLGLLEHSELKNSIMFADYEDIAYKTKHLGLAEEDIQRIQALYGPRNEEPAVETTVVPVMSTTTPVPVETTPVPVETTPVPVETTPVPVGTTPVPVETTPVPAETTPVPVETTPVPVETTPVPMETTPVPVETTPVPVETTPMP